VSKKQFQMRRRGNCSIENAILDAIELRNSLFKINDEQLIRTMDLLIYALGSVATRRRLENLSQASRKATSTSCIAVHSAVAG